MKKLTLDLDGLSVETFAVNAQTAQEEKEMLFIAISRQSCIEQCTTSCVP
ncbi:MAG TPA: hypothetical protein VF771_18755 [Longimicrobiaceae bacterium]